MNILLSIMALGAMGLAFGIGLSYANKKFKVDSDPRIEAITDALPAANCGACGLPGCGNFATAIVSGDVKPEDCPVAGFDAVQSIGKIMGVEVVESARKTAYIRCGGGFSNSEYRYDYQGMTSCTAAMQLASGGAKSCSYGCLGEGSCVAVCDFDAITIKDGVAKVIEQKCVACLKCVSSCPKNLIIMIPQDSKIRVACNARDDARTVRANCKVGCIGCRICQRLCEPTAIKIFDQLAEIDYEKCNDCKACVEKCPMKCIIAN